MSIDTRLQAPATGHPRSGLRFVPLLAVSAGYFMVILDATVVTVALPRLGRDLGTTVGGLQWVVDAYTVAFAGLLLLGGSLGDRIGSRTVFLGALATFTAASVACGLAPSPAVLIGARVQGIAAAAIVPSSLALLRAAYPGEAERARAFGVWGGIAGVAAASGPIIGGALTSFVSWRAVFMVNAPIGVAVFLLTRRLVPVTSRREGAGVDPLGQSAAIVALAALVVGLIEGGEAGWEDPVVVAAFAVAVVAAAVLLASERRAHDPILPRELFRSRAFTGATVVGLLLNLGFWGQLFVMSLFAPGAHRQWRPA
jgi:DHA2 family methylenomycin A resistance protein-like MFS transporter